MLSGNSKSFYFFYFITLFLAISSNPVIAETVLSEESTTDTLLSEESKPVESEQVLSFENAVLAINVKSFKEKQKAISRLSEFDDPRVLPILTALIKNNFFYRKSDKLIVIATKVDDLYQLTDPVNNQDLGAVKKNKLKKIRTNNKLRRHLRGAIAKIKLSNSDPDVRLAAVNELISKVSDETLALFQTSIQTEIDQDVLAALHAGIALSEIKHEDKSIRLNALETLSTSLLPEARNSISALIEKDNDGNYLESDPVIIAVAKKSIQRINEKVKFYDFIETLFFGLSLGSVLLLAAIGLAITFGVMGVINMAHGELIMLGAYTTYLIQYFLPGSIEYSLFIAIPAAFMVSGLFGIAIERGIIRHLYGRPLETLLATFGVSLILQQLVRVAISAQNVPVETPQWMSGTLEINSALSMTYNRLYILLFCLMVFFGLMAILKKTRLGLQVRAVSQNRSMAKAMGVKTEWVDALTFGLGSGIAGIAGVALSQLTNVGPNMGQSYIIDSFMVVVFGGVGNLWGTLVGAMSLGVVNKFLEPWSGAVLAKIFVLVFIILFIQKKPRGLFPQKGRAAEH